VRDEQAIIAATLEPPPAALGVTHWSARLLADHLGVSFTAMARIGDVVGPYLDPPAKAVVACIDDKTQIQALDRTAPILTMRPEIPQKQTHDDKSNGTTTPFAALEVATRLVTDRCFAQHTDVEFLAFGQQVARAYPRVPLHVVCDNDATHKQPRAPG